MDMRILSLIQWIIFVWCGVYIYTTEASPAELQSYSSPNYYLTKEVSIVELQSYNYPDYYLQTAHQDREKTVAIRRRDPVQQWEIIKPGLCRVKDSVSIRISHSYNIYLRYRDDGLVYAEASDHSSSFSDSACFYIRYDKWFPGHAVFESVVNQDYYLRHQSYQLKLHRYTETALFEMDASFRILIPNCRKFQSYNYEDHYIGLTGREAYISTTAHLWVPLRPGLSGHKGSVSFRSCDNSTRYLRHSGFLLRSDPFDYTQLFKLDATFTERQRFHPKAGTTAYESVNYPNRFIRHSGYRLRLDDYDAAPVYKADASYYEL